MNLFRIPSNSSQPLSFCTFVHIISLSWTKTHTDNLCSKFCSFTTVTTCTANNGRQLKTRNSYAAWSQQGYHCCRFYSELQFALRQVMKQASPPYILTFTCKERKWSVMLQIYLLIDVFSWHSLCLWPLLSSFSTPALTDNSISKLHHDIRKKLLVFVLSQQNW